MLFHFVTSLWFSISPLMKMNCFYVFIGYLDSSFMNLSSSFWPFFNLDCLLLICRNSLHYLSMFFVRTHMLRLSAPSVWLIFSLLMASFEEEKFLSQFFPCGQCFSCLPIPLDYEDILTCFSSKSFSDSDLFIT